MSQEMYIAGIYWFIFAGIVALIAFVFLTFLAIMQTRKNNKIVTAGSLVDEDERMRKIAGQQAAKVGLVGMIVNGWRH